MEDLREDFQHGFGGVRFGHEMDAAGRVIRSIGMVQDITEEKRSEAEREKLEAQNRLLQKSESLGRMAGAIAHHFNNQLQTIMMDLDFAMHNQGKVADATLEEAMQAARKAAELSSMMLSYLGQAEAKRTPINLSATCLRNLSLLRAGMPKKAVLETDLPTPGPVIRADAIQIHQVLTNLVTNAWEASRDKGGAIRLTVKTVGAADISAMNRLPMDSKLPAPTYACLEVADKGSGVQPKDIEKLFDPFFSTKFTGRGMGLAVVLGIVRAHEGCVTVESEPDRGSIFRVFLPVSAGAVPVKPVPTTQASAAVGSGTVLLVEDEETVRKTRARALTRLGYEVLEAKDGIVGVEVFRQHRDEIGCVLCDLTMPRMGGWETLTALRKLAAKILHNAEANHAQYGPSNIAYFALQHAKSGRRAAGYSKSDVLASATQLNGRSRVWSMEHPIPVGEETNEEFGFQELVECDQDDPSQLAARKLDWEAFLEGQSDRTKAVLTFMLEGRSLTYIAAKCRVCPATIQHMKDRLTQEIKAFMGEDVLAQVAKQPEWRSNLRALREKHTTRASR